MQFHHRASTVVCVGLFYLCTPTRGFSITRQRSFCNAKGSTTRTMSSTLPTILLAKKKSLNQDEGYKEHIKETIEKMDPKDVIRTNSTDTKLIAKIKETPEPKEHGVKPEILKKLSDMTKAQEKFSKLNQEDVDRIFNAVAQEANLQRLPLAKMAVLETEMGCFEDKVLKNGLACELIRDRYANAKTCDLIHEDLYHGMKTYAKPVGPVCCLTPGE
jgi:acyl-CoA reductase-like NAD-dependent aldehyde dehydrogenase